MDDDWEILVGGWPTPLKNDGVRQLGWWHFQYMESHKTHVPTPIQLAITGDKNSGTHGTPWRLEDINNDKQTHGFEHKKHKVSMNFHNEICWTSPTIKAKPRRVGTPRRLNDPQTYWSFQLRSQRQRMFRLLFWCIMVRIMVHICAYAPNLFMLDERGARKNNYIKPPFETQSRQTQSNQAADLDMSKSSSVSRQYSRSSGKACVMSSLPQWSRNFDAEKGLRMARPPKSCWALQRQKKPMWTYDAERLWSIRSMMHENTVSM